MQCGHYQNLLTFYITALQAQEIVEGERMRKEADIQPCLQTFGHSFIEYNSRNTGTVCGWILHWETHLPSDVHPHLTAHQLGGNHGVASLRIHLGTSC